MFRTSHILHALLLVVLVSASVSATKKVDFLYGFGGFGFSPESAPIDHVSAQFEISPYFFWGSTIFWQTDEYRIAVATYTVYRPGSTMPSKDQPDILSKWKTAALDEYPTLKRSATEIPFSFNGSKGVEIRLSTPTKTIYRAFFLRGQLIIISLFATGTKDATSYLSIVNSFRLLSKNERIFALISEFAPPPLVQERPTRLPISDAVEMGLQGQVRRIRELKYSKDQKTEEFVRETYFDKDGFTLSDIDFREGYPDVITTWGWVNGQRVNIQSAVNFPTKEIPKSRRDTIISGSFVLPFVGTIARPEQLPVSEYGNRFAIQIDDQNRVKERRHLTNFGSTVVVEKITYSQDARSIKSTDDAGGFIGWTREKVDARKNVVEFQLLSSDGSVVETTGFQYKFDVAGNWTEKTATKMLKIGRRPVKRPGETIFRNIQYFESNDRRQIATSSRNRSLSLSD